MCFVRELEFGATCVCFLCLGVGRAYVKTSKVGKSAALTDWQALWSGKIRAV